MAMRGAVCLLVVFALVFADVHAWIMPYCRSGWEEYGNHCYYFGREQVTWHKAQGICTGRGGYLVKIGNDAENVWLQSQLHGRHMWIGLNDKAGEGDWRWVSDNSRPTFTHWLGGEPNGGRTENCVHFFYYGKWNDRPCSYPTRYICEKN